MVLLCEKWPCSISNLSWSNTVVTSYLNHFSYGWKQGVLFYSCSRPACKPPHEEPMVSFRGQCKDSRCHPWAFAQDPSGSFCFAISCPSAQVQASSDATTDFFPFLLINPLKKTLKALVQNFCLAYSDTGLRFSLCCLNSSCPWHAPQPVRRSLLTEPIFLCRYQMDLW